MSKLTLVARAVTQDGVTFYESALPAHDLLDDRFEVDRWNNTSQRGYQREINDPHSQRIAQYLKGKVESTNVMPTSIVINVREPLGIKPLIGKDVVEIEVPSGVVCYVMDGQHRINGVRKVSQDNESTLEDYEFGITLTNLPLEQEMIHFKNLNTTANRPAKGLSQVIGHQMYQMTGVAPASYTDQATNKAVAMTIRLAIDNDSPLYGKIAIGGIRRRSFHTTVQSQVVTALLPLFLNGRFSDPTMNPTTQYQYILDFLKAVETTWPDATSNPESHSILRTTGLSVLFKILIKIFNNLNLNPSRSDFEAILADIRMNLEVVDSSWAMLPNAQLNSLRAGYSLNRGNTIVSDFLWSGVETKAHSTMGV